MNWQKIRQIAMDEANHECCDCGSSNNIEVHHMSRTSIGEYNEISDLSKM